MKKRLKELNHKYSDLQKAGSLFGNEKDQPFKSSLETIYQTFDGVNLYPTMEKKVANMLYFVVRKYYKERK